MTDQIANERILIALRDARKKIEARNEAIAIVGMAGRFPGAENIDDFWEMLAEGRVGTRTLTPEELQASGIPEELFNRIDYIPTWSSFNDPDCFDAAFFGYSPSEAKLLDPQHRVFLECAWNALEHAGYDSNRYAEDTDGNIGVFAGAALNSYVINLHNDAHTQKNTDKVQAVVSNVLGLMATRVSYHLNLTGPSCGVQTGCSTSLVAIHQACRSLLDNECDMALAGGVTVSEVKPQGYLYQEGSISSPDGLCRAFDAQGKGTVFGNGVGVLILKRLSKAQADGDSIYAVIRGTAVNNDGADKVGLIAPSVSGQASVISSALKTAQIDPATLSYIEAHGTGTDLGDPIEVSALHKALNPVFNKTGGHCAIGSVKTNLGHLDAAAGVAGMIKTILALHNQAIPKSLNYTTPNPNIEFNAGPLQVNTQLIPWPVTDTPRRAGVSSFGMGGTNAHAILEESPLRTKSSSELPARQWQLLPLSACSDKALQTLTVNLATQLHKESDLDLSSVAFTLQQGRRTMDRRQFAVANTLADAIECCSGQSKVNGCPIKLAKASDSQIAFLFPGQGSQYVGMAQALYQSEPVFRVALDECVNILSPHLSLLHLLYSSEASDDDKNTEIMQTSNAQPILFSVEYALAKMWLAWGVEPQAMIGHSIGEYVAACLAGVFSLEDALTLVVRRGQLMQRCARGGMLAVTLPEADLKILLEGSAKNVGYELAAVNSRQQCVISGTNENIQKIQLILQRKNISSTLLKTSHAFHSVAMEPILEAFEQAVASVQLNSPNMDIVSNVSGKVLSDEQAISPRYWMRQLRHCVRFGDGIKNLIDKGDWTTLEIGPGAILSRLMPKDRNGKNINTINTLANSNDENLSVTIALGDLWLAGVDINWSAYNENRPQQRIALPLYPFERQRYWVDLKSKKQTSSTSTEDNDEEEKCSDASKWYSIPTWQPSILISDVRSTTGVYLFIAEEVQREELKPFFETGKVNSDNIIWLSLKEDVATLTEKLSPHKKAATQVVYFLSQSKSTHGDNTLKVQPAIHNLLAILSATHKTLEQDMTFTLVSSGAWRLAGSEVVQPEQAALNGLLQVAGQELEGLRTRQIDLEVGHSLSSSHILLHQSLQKELQQPWGQDTRIIALRNGQRWLRNYQEVILPKTQGEHPVLRKQGTYLIIGDLTQGLGMVFAQGLFQHYGARLVLVGEQQLPRETEWEQWLATHGPKHPTSIFIRTLQCLRLDGADIHLLRGDIGDQDWLKTSLLQASMQFGDIHGAFYVDEMGDRSSCTIEKTTEQECQRIIGKRLAGVQTLAQVLGLSRFECLDFVVLQSSLSTIVGGAGFGVYATANSALDAIASEQTNAVPWLSINWDAVHNDIMAVKESENTVSATALMATALSVDEAWQAMDRILAQTNLNQVIVSPRNLKIRLDTAFDPELKAQGNKTDTNNPQDHSRPDIETPYLEPRTLTEQIVAKAMGDLLGINQVGALDDFFDLGGHSLLAIQAITRLRKEFGVELPMRALLFEARTVEGIANLIDKGQQKKQTEIEKQKRVIQATTTENNTEDDDLEALLNDVENMTTEEAQRKLESE